MFRTLCLAAAAAGVLVVSGCAAPQRVARLTYESRPLGAMLYEDGKPIGVAPVMRTYPAEADGGQVHTPDVTAVWPSGARTSFWTMLKPGDDRVATLERPPQAANLQADLDNAQKFANEEARHKEMTRREIARDSARCKAQQHSGGGAIDDCN